ncbi:hypothetical protein AB0368_29410 [Actinoplanes sp. NPDC051475]|uniref:hypothetical protein n=1 Tax=Actinoplanes sp. NPDC051475 TaxID=3157225 RepID=UPI0034507A1E
MNYRRRFSTAVDALRGRPPRTDYGILLVMPFLAAAGGSLVGLAVDAAVQRRRTRTPAPVPEEPRERAGTPVAVPARRS